MESGVASWSSSPRLTAGSSCVSVNNGGIRPKESTKSMDADGCRTTFVEADTDSFRQVVQMLTGHGTTTVEGSKALLGPKKTYFKLNERRRSLKNLKMIRPPSHSKKPSSPAILSPSVLDFPSMALISPITPLTLDPFQRTTAEEEEEEWGIPEKGFYLHSSPRSAAESPRLLPLFPVTSPRTSSAGGSS
ncbi:VQ motif-containing protein 4-like [Zingiber officinale]|uniref:VQ domain-containing protein n=1 Tax=Zingiber officinale TaxID=94328 RepID=A0A8J5G902_ZINOF|nr:VQ motif-containing protein 4-like [Zingiber officinale]KAG6500624.1 hypothetical protein ZIOFF_040472 [Zingiber officinale]